MGRGDGEIWYAKSLFQTRLPCWLAASSARATAESPSASGKGAGTPRTSAIRKPRPRAGRRATEGEEPRVRQVEDAALAVVELAEEQHQRVITKAMLPVLTISFASGRERASPCSSLDEALRVAEVLDDVEQQDVVEVREVDVGQAVVQIVLMEPSSSTPRRAG